VRRNHEQQHKQHRQHETRDQRECRMKWMAVEEAAIVGVEVQQRFHNLPPRVSALKQSVLISIYHCCCHVVSDKQHTNDS